MSIIREHTASTRAVAYVRVSTEAQAESGNGINAQIDAVYRWGIANGYERQEIAIYSDNGISGKSTDREGLQMALEYARREGKARKSGIPFIVHKLDRLARSTADLINLSAEFENNNIDLVSVNEKIDTTSPTGRMVFRILASIAEFERDITAQRTRDALAAKSERGERISRHIPYGYDCPDDVHLIENEQEQAAIALMKELRSSGATLKAICEELNERGIKAKKGNWAPCTVWQILKRAA